MAAKTTGAASYANNLLSLIFNSVSYAGFASATGATNLWISLHTAALTGASTQSTSEAGYPSYARMSVTRTTAGWTVTTNTVIPVSTIVFPTSTGSPSETEVAFGIGTTSSAQGATVLWHYFTYYSGYSSRRDPRVDDR